MSERAQRIARNLWRWDTPHPLWRPGMDAEAGCWDQEVVMQGLAVRSFEADGEVASGVEALLVGGLRRGEVVYWLPERRPRDGRGVPGPSRRLARGEAPCLDSREALYELVRGLERLPVTLVLPTHGPPAPDGSDVIRRAVERAPWRPNGSGG